MEPTTYICDGQGILEEFFLAPLTLELEGGTFLLNVWNQKTSALNVTIQETWIVNISAEETSELAKLQKIFYWISCSSWCITQYSYQYLYSEHPSWIIL